MFLIFAHYRPKIKSCFCNVQKSSSKKLTTKKIRTYFSFISVESLQKILAFVKQKISLIPQEKKSLGPKTKNSLGLSS